MATFTTNYPSMLMAQGDFAAWANGLSLTLNGAADSLNNAGYNLDTLTATIVSASTTFVSGSLSNGDQFSYTGENLLAYPASISHINYLFSAASLNVGIDGSITVSGADMPATGLITHAALGVPGTTIDITGSVDLSTSGGTLTKIVTTSGGGSVTYTGSVLLTSPDGGVTSDLSGTISGISAKFGSYSGTLTGLSADPNTLPDTTSLDTFLAWALAGNDTVNGSAGDNELLGYAGNDKIYGKGGFDTLTGGAGADQLSGGDGADELHGGTGHDRLTGGTGSDAFVFEGAVRAANSDHITDFTPVDDAIVLDGTQYANFFVGPGQAITAKYFYASSSVDDVGATRTYQRILYDTDSGNLYYDPDGSGVKAAVLLAVIDNHAALTADDIRSAL